MDSYALASKSKDSSLDAGSTTTESRTPGNSLPKAWATDSLICTRRSRQEDPCSLTCSDLTPSSSLSCPTNRSADSWRSLASSARLFEDSSLAFKSAFVELLSLSASMWFSTSTFIAVTYAFSFSTSTPRLEHSCRSWSSSALQSSSEEARRETSISRSLRSALKVPSATLRFSSSRLRSDMDDLWVLSILTTLASRSATLELLVLSSVSLACSSSSKVLIWCS
mmetsp:Transcript_2792/g.10353  ORF Transcript_2792/g.10353 Transcript_2792/m.10353 type:complete len:224 (-) Transcript_2792:917-1588(-)